MQQHFNSDYKMIHFHFISSQMEMIIAAAIMIASFNKNKIWLFNKANDICTHFFCIHIDIWCEIHTCDIHIYESYTECECVQITHRFHLTISLTRSSASFTASGN
jgi:hypothetical protein